MDRNNITVPWNGWKITKELGKGTYGAVFEIERELFDSVEKAAMKVISIPPDEAMMDNILFSAGYDTATVQKSLQKELRKAQQEYILMNKLKGITNIVSCEDFAYQEREDGRGYLVFIRMELLKSLKLEIREKRRKSEFFTEDEVIRIGRDVSRALVACDQRGLIHRDIKPSNILVSQYGDYKIGDFGTARGFEYTMQATFAGTQSFMAPEVYKRQPYGKTVDIYSLGLVMYWLMNRCHMPFVPLDIVPGSDELQAAETRRVRGDKLPAPYDASKEFSEIILKACEPDTGKRYHTASEMLRDLTDLMEGRYTLKSSAQNTAEGENTSFISTFNLIPEADDFDADEPTMAMFELPDRTEDESLTVPAPEVQAVPVNEVPAPSVPPAPEVPAPSVPVPEAHSQHPAELPKLQLIEQTMSAYLDALAAGNTETAGIFPVPDAEVPYHVNPVVYWLNNVISGNVAQDQETGSKLYEMAEELETKYGKLEEALELYRISSAAGLKKASAKGLQLSKLVQSTQVQTDEDGKSVFNNVNLRVQKINRPEELTMTLAVYVACMSDNPNHYKKLRGEVIREVIRSGLAAEYYRNAPSLITDINDPKDWLSYPEIKGYYAVDNYYIQTMLKNLFHLEVNLYKGTLEDVYYTDGKFTYIFENESESPVYPNIVLLDYSKGLFADEIKFAAVYGPSAYDLLTARIRQRDLHWEVMDVYIESRHGHAKRAEKPEVFAADSSPQTNNGQASLNTENKLALLNTESGQASLKKILSVYIACKSDSHIHDRKLRGEVIREVIRSGLAADFYKYAPALITDKKDPEGWISHPGIKGYYVVADQYIQKLLQDLFNLDASLYREPLEDVFYSFRDYTYIFEKESDNLVYPKIENIRYINGMIADEVSFSVESDPYSYECFTARLRQHDFHWEILDVYKD